MIIGITNPDAHGALAANTVNVADAVLITVYVYESTALGLPEVGALFNHLVVTPEVVPSTCTDVL
jgi:hypothetical protein